MLPRFLKVNARKKKAVSSVIGGVIVFAIVFSTIATYFVFTEQQTNQRALLNQQAANESFTVAGGITATSVVEAKVTDIGPSSISIVSLVVGCASGCGAYANNAVMASCNLAPAAGVNPGASDTAGASGWIVLGTSPAAVCTALTFTTGETIWIKAISSLGTVETAMYPSSGVIAGTVGDLLMTFNSFTYYQVNSCTSAASNPCAVCTSSQSSSCAVALTPPAPKCQAPGSTVTGAPSGTTASGYCLSSGAPANTVPVVNIGGSSFCDGDADSDDLPAGSSGGTAFYCPAYAFSVSVTDLNQQQLSITLDQFTLFYQGLQTNNPFPDNTCPSPCYPELEAPPALYVAWYVVSVANGQILNEYSPVTLAYNVPTTVYFAAVQCVATVGGSNLNPPKGSQCGTLGYSSSETAPQIQEPPSPVATTNIPDLIAGAYLEAHGWEYSASVTTGSFCYVSCVDYTNFGQTLPFLTTLYVSSPTLGLSPVSGPPGTAVTLVGAGYAAGTTYSYCLITSANYNAGTLTCIAGAGGSGTFIASGGGSIPANTKLTIPATTTIGSPYYVVVYTGTTFAGVVAAAQFQVTATLTLNPPSGPGGTTTTLSGSYYAASTAYDYCLSNNPNTISCVAGTASTFTSTGTGTIPSVPLTIPAGQAAGTYYVIVYTPANVIVASATFNVVYPTLNITPTTSASSGTVVTLCGTESACTSSATQPSSGYSTTSTYQDCFASFSAVSGTYTCLTAAGASWTPTATGGIPNTPITVTVPAGLTAGTTYYVIVWNTANAGVAVATAPFIFT